MTAKRREKRITDKERLDWYNKNGPRIVAHYSNLTGYLRPAMWLLFDGTCNPGKPFNTVRQAIDAAIRAARRQEKKK